MEAVGSKWEDLNTDYLVNIFTRVGLESLVLDLPYVCKSWYKATRDPQCWSILNFTRSSPSDAYGFPHNNFSPRLKEKYISYKTSQNTVTNLIMKLVKGLFSTSPDAVTNFIVNVIKRGNRFVTYVELPSLCTAEALICISKECPNLKTLKLANAIVKHDQPSLFPSLVCKWKRLESLSVVWSFNIGEIIEQISLNCNNFGTLEVVNGEIGRNEANSIVILLPNLKGLRLRLAYVKKKNILMIVKGCKKLEYLDVRDCVGFDESIDDDILEFASHIPTINLEGNMLRALTCRRNERKHKVGPRGRLRSPYTTRTIF